MEHIPADRKAAEELVRVLKPDGSLVVSVPRYYPESICWRLSSEYFSANGGHVRIYRKSEIIRLFGNAGARFRFSHHAHSLHTPYWWLKCWVGPAREDQALVRRYHQLLTWDIMKKPRITRLLDTLLNPVLGKSLVLYFRKPA
jgi:SAM-dependent methyltransferase